MSKLKKAAGYGGSFALVVLSTPDLAHALYVCSQCTLSTTSKGMDSQQISQPFFSLFLTHFNLLPVRLSLPYSKKDLQYQFWKKADRINKNLQQNT